MSSLRQEARKLQLKTQIADMHHQTKSYNVASVARRCNEQLKALQESYKELTGAYMEECMPIEEKAPEITYKEISIDELIDQLNLLKAKTFKNVQLVGTLMCKDDGNSILYSTEKQM